MGVIIETRKHSSFIYAKPLRVPLAGIWEIYFEKKWRILFEIDENEKVIIIVGFKHKDEMS
jgi:mRNA-degrading endonuclease RelE of RelBE toxin-antitoxin system